jgi:hypothetical protein
MMFLAHQSWYVKRVGFRAGVWDKNGDDNRQVAAIAPQFDVAQALLPAASARKNKGREESRPGRLKPAEARATILRRHGQAMLSLLELWGNHDLGALARVH